ncbi:hypothetical protein O181_116379, partial [Austropuccinia psidii MF-1]|nr:hypothetical protein [Austropuccinia psidii MF-1]
SKDFLSHMGELTNEDYKFFDDYLSLERALIEDSKDEHPPTAQELQGSIKRAGNSYHCTSQKRRNQAFNEVTLETQDKSEALHCIMANNSSCRVDSDSEIMLSVQPPGEIFSLSICSQSNSRRAHIQRAQRLKLSIQLYTSTPDGKNYYLSKEIWSSMEFMEPILVLFEKACNVFQSKSPTKHLVLPYYWVIMKQLEHYACVSPITWHQACEAAQAKLQNYYDLEVKNDDTLIATLLNPRYCKVIFTHLKVPASRANVIVGQLMNECATMTCIRAVELEDPADVNSSDQISEADDNDLLCHLGQTPIETNDETPLSHKDKVVAYLQNLHPMSRGEHIVDYWKVSNLLVCKKQAVILMPSPLGSIKLSRAISPCWGKSPCNI